MLGTTSYWDRLHLAYTFEINKRTKSIAWRFNLSPEERKQALSQFEPGEIAHIDGHGGIYGAFYELLERNGLVLTSQEKGVKRRLDREASGIGKYCLVLQRLNERQHIVCYITSFGQAIYAKNISPIAKFFSLAMGDTPAWPPGHRPLSIFPGWAGGGFLFGVPVVRSDLSKTKNLHIRFIAGWGELDRLKLFIMERMDTFKHAHKTLRQHELNWQRSRRSNFIKHDEEMVRAVAEHYNQADRTGENEVKNLLKKAEKEALNAEGGVMDDEAESMLGVGSDAQADGNAARVAYHQTAREWSNCHHFGHRRARLPPIHLLECPEPNNVEWLLRYMRQDIMYSSIYLNRLHAKTTTKPRPLLKRLPLPFKKIR